MPTLKELKAKAKALGHTGPFNKGTKIQWAARIAQLEHKANFKR